MHVTPHPASSSDCVASSAVHPHQQRKASRLSDVQRRQQRNEHSEGQAAAKAYHTLQKRQE